MGYYGHSVYRGDYYGQGDYYRKTAGDPGFFDFISDVGGAVLGAAKSILPAAAPIVGGLFGGPAGMALGGLAGGVLGRVLGPGAPIPTPPMLPMGPPPVWSATSPGTGSTLAMIPSSPFGGVGPNPMTTTYKRVPMPGGSGMAHFLGGGGGRSGGAGVSGLNGAPVSGHFHKGRCGATHTAFRRVDSWEVKDSRRMNPLNPHALRRSLRRAGAFTKLVSKSLRFTKPGHHVGGFKKVGRRKK